MAITRIKNSSIANEGPKYNTALAGLPYLPTIGTATDGGTGTTVSVAFTANNSAGAGVTYTALSSPGSLTGTASASPVTVSGLTSGTAYTFQVKAGNTFGDSAYSAASNSVTPVNPSSYESIATATGTGSSAVITFSSIPSTFKHLQIRYIGRTTNSATERNYYIRLNSDSGSNYAYHRLYGTGSTVGAEGYATQTEAYCSSSMPGALVASNIIGVGITDLLDYASTSKNKTLRTIHGYDSNGTGNINISSGVWLSTSAVDTITLTLGSGNWTTESDFALYGIKESA